MTKDQQSIIKELKVLVEKLETSFKETETIETKDWRNGAPDSLPPKK